MRILITEPDRFSAKAVETLEEGGFEVDLFEGELEAVAEELPGYDGAVVRLGLHWDSSLLKRTEGLKFLATLTTGLSHIDLTAAAEEGVEVISLRGLEGLERVTSTAEHAFGMLLALVRNTCGAARSVLDGVWGRDLFIGNELKGKTAGVIGMGRLGGMFARIAEAFQMEVAYFDPYVEHERYRRCPSLLDLAGESDVASIHAGLSAESSELVGKEYFEACRRGQFLVNTSRGEIIDEAALISALEHGRVAGAALDVLANEPQSGRMIDSPMIAYAGSHGNLLITPHIGGATFEAMHFTEEILAREIVRRRGDASGVSGHSQEKSP